MAFHDCRTSDPALLAALSDGILTLTLNRPEVLNALTFDMFDALGEQLAQAEVSEDVRCIVLTGAGKGFSAGGDVKAMLAGSIDGPAMTDALISRQRLAQRATIGRLFRMSKPTLAVINGAAAGAGLSLALACDLRIMADTAVLMTAFARVGLSGDFGGTWLMNQLIGQARTRELYMLSERVDARRSVELGLANWSCPAEGLAAEADAIARRLAAGSPTALRGMKENIARAATGELEDCLDIEATLHIHCMATDEHKAAAAAFVAKAK